MGTRIHYPFQWLLLVDLLNVVMLLSQLCLVINTHTHTHTHTNVLRLSVFCPGQPGWAGTRRKIHPLILIVVINHPLSASPSVTIHGILSVQFTYLTVFFHNLCKFSLVYLLAWHPPLHTPYISSPNHCIYDLSLPLSLCYHLFGG